MQIRHVTLPLLGTLSIGMCIFFIHLHMNYTVRKAETDLLNQNFEYLQKGDTYALANRLNALTASGEWVCVRGLRAGVEFYKSSYEDCDADSVFNKEIKISGSSGITIELRNVIPTYLLYFFAAFIFLQIATIAAAVFYTRLEGKQRALLAENFLLIARRTAHDIKSPLSVLQIIYKTLENVSLDKKNLVITAVDRIQTIAEDLLRESRQPGFKQDLKGRSTKLADLLSSVQSLIREKNIEFEGRLLLNNLLDKLENLEAYASGDISMVTRIISNLINNAFQASSNHSPVVMKIIRKPQHLSIKVTDRGSGIAPDLLHILGSKEITTSKTQGNGIAIFEAKKYLSSHGGDLIIESEQGQGTNVEILIRLT